MALVFRSLSTLSTILCLFAALPMAWAQTPLCERLFITPASQFKSDIRGRLSSHAYEDVLFQVDQLLEPLGPLPAGYTVRLKNHYGQDAKHIFGSRQIEFNEIHTTYRKYTGAEDPRITLPILAHEYSHAYFETAMRKLSPLWEKNSRFLDLPFGDPELKREVAAKISVYHEFFADLVPAVLFNNPRAIVEALQFHESSPPSQTIKFRDWTVYSAERDNPVLKEIFQNRTSDITYVYLSPLRPLVWNESRKLNTTHDHKKFFLMIVKTLAHDYQQRAESGSFSFSRINKELEQAFSKEFAAPSDN